MHKSGCSGCLVLAGVLVFLPSFAELLHPAKADKSTLAWSLDLTCRGNLESRAHVRARQAIASGVVKEGVWALKPLSVLVLGRVSHLLLSV